MNSRSNHDAAENVTEGDLEQDQVGLNKNGRSFLQAMNALPRTGVSKKMPPKEDVKLKEDVNDKKLSAEISAVELARI